MPEYLIEHISGDITARNNLSRRKRDSVKARDEYTLAAQERAKELVSADEKRRRESLEKWRKGDAS